MGDKLSCQPLLNGEKLLKGNGCAPNVRDEETETDKQGRDGGEQPNCVEGDEN